MALAIGVALVLLAIAFALYPLFKSSDADQPIATDPAVARAALYQEILDTELDMRLGKITQTDYQITRGRLLHEATLLMTEPAEGPAEDPATAVEREIAAARASMQRGRFTEGLSPS